MLCITYSSIYFVIHKKTQDIILFRQNNMNICHRSMSQESLLLFQFASCLLLQHDHSYSTIQQNPIAQRIHLCTSSSIYIRNCEVKTWEETQASWRDVYTTIKACAGGNHLPYKQGDGSYIPHYIIKSLKNYQISC